MTALRKLFSVLALCAIIVASLAAAETKKSRSDSSAHGEEEDVTPRPKRKTSVEATPRPKATSKSQGTKSTARKTDDDSASDETEAGVPKSASATAKKKTKSATPRATPSKTGTKKGNDATPKPEPSGKDTSDDALAPLPKRTSASTPKPAKPDAAASATAAKTTAAIDPAAPPPEQVPSERNASLASADLLEFAKQPPKVQRLVESALALTKQNLTYSYGSADPSTGGMDCSGFVYHVLRQNGFTDVPRQASEQYVWVRKAHEFDAVLSKKKESFELDDILPGDLLFWTGTYTVERDPPVTHAMIYLGTERATKQRVMVGSSDGRTYRGKSRWGVSVFDFQGGQTSRDPAKQGRGGFVGYATIPGLRD